MKKNIIIIGLVVLFASCSDDFMTNVPQGSLNDGVMGSSDGAELLVNAAYEALMVPNAQDNNALWNNFTNWSYSEVRSDNAYKGGGGTGDGNEVHRMETFDVDANNGHLDGKWFALYCSIQRCNSALKVLNKYSDDEIKNRQSRIGEMKVLRAHFFFELSRLFNRIPYFDENVADNDGYLKISNTQYTRDQILEKIVNELMEASKVLPETQDEVGRVHKYTALAYAAKVNLYRAYKQDETTHEVTNIDKSLLQEVVRLIDQVEAGRGYALLPDFQGLDLVANDNGSESVFAIQHSMNDGTKDGGRINWSNLLNSPGGNSPYKGDGFFLPSQDLINAYQTDANGLPVFDYQTLPDYSVVTFVDDDHQSIANVSHSVDPRLDFVVGRPTITWKTYKERPCQSWVRDRGAYGHNCIKRFWVSPESPDMYPAWPWGASALNWQIIRYADLLLWKAEALIEIGTDLEGARTCINAIRQRAMNSARVKDFTDNTQDAANYSIGLYPSSGWTQEYARQALRTETRLEKAFEGERYFDLVRWGIAGDVMSNYIARERQNESTYGNTNHRDYYDNAQYHIHQDEYFPIPVNQYSFSKGLYKQNPGYPAFN